MSSHTQFMLTQLTSGMGFYKMPMSLWINYKIIKESVSKSVKSQHVVMFLSQDLLIEARQRLSEITLDDSCYAQLLEGLLLQVKRSHR